MAYAIQSLGLSPTAVGITLGIYGGGMLFVVGPLFGFCAALMMLLTVWVPSNILTAMSFFLFDSGPILWTIATTTLRQAVTPDVMLGRVSGLIMAATFGAKPVGRRMALSWPPGLVWKPA